MRVGTGLGRWTGGLLSWLMMFSDRRVVGISDLGVHLGDW